MSDIVENPLRHPMLKEKVCICGSGKKIRTCCGEDHFISLRRFEILEKELMEVYRTQADLEKLARGH